MYIQKLGKRPWQLGHFFKRFSGYSPTQSRRLFDLFQEQIVQWENIVRWRWAEGDVAIWDNRQRSTVRLMTMVMNFVWQRVSLLKVMSL